MTVTLWRAVCTGPAGKFETVSARVCSSKLYEWKPMPRAPPMSNRATPVVPIVSNLAKPYGYRSVGGFRDSRQQNSTTRSPRRSTTRLIRIRKHEKGRRGTHRLVNALHLLATMQSANTSQRRLSPP
jgi:hypothetical protein